MLASVDGVVTYLLSLLAGFLSTVLNILTSLLSTLLSRHGGGGGKVWEVR